MKQYDLFELIWKAQAPENSDVKADLQADFLYEDGEIVKVKGFYAGAETYKVRFLPVKTGKIMWKISGIINEEGTEFCEPNENGTGLVKAVGTHFEYQNGKRFASFGTTIYALAHQEKDLPLLRPRPLIKCVTACSRSIMIIIIMNRSIIPLRKKRMEAGIPNIPVLHTGIIWKKSSTAWVLWESSQT